MRYYFVLSMALGPLFAVLICEDAKADPGRRSRLYSRMNYGMQSYMQNHQSPYKQGSNTLAFSVGAYDDHFGPNQITVLPGTTVRWYNYGIHSHTITSSDGVWDSGAVMPGGSYSITFSHPGVYRYYCRVHGKEKMQGTVIVGTGIPSPRDDSRSPGY